MDSKDKSGTSKDLDSRPDVFIKSTRNDNSEAYPGVHVQIESTNDFGTNQKPTGGSESSKGLENNSEDGGGTARSKQPELNPEHINRSGSNEHNMLNPVDRNVDGGLPLTPVKLGSSISFSSFSSEDDLFEVQPEEDFNPMVHTTSREPNEYAKPATKDHESPSTTSSNTYFDPRSTSQVSNSSNPFLDSTSLSQVSNVANHTLGHGLSPTKSPTVQVMDENEGYDPSRIPSSVFERSNSASQKEWSAFSNDSLFSIHVGNNSFLPDFGYMSPDIGRSGEHHKSDELFAFTPPLPKAAPSPPKAAPSPPMVVREITTQPSYPPEERRALRKEDSLATEERLPDVLLYPDLQSKGNQVTPQLSKKSTDNSTHSRNSMDSAYSFAFPILTETTKHASKNEGVLDQQPQPQTQTQTETELENSKSSSCCFNCVSCLPRCPGWCCRCNLHCCF